MEVHNSVGAEEVRSMAVAEDSRAVGLGQGRRTYRYCSEEKIGGGSMGNAAFVSRIEVLVG